MTTAQCKIVRNRYRTRFGDWAPMDRPNFKKTSVTKQQRKLQAQLQKMKDIAARKGRAR